MAIKHEPRHQADAGSQQLSLGATLSAIARSSLPIGFLGLILHPNSLAGMMAAALLLFWASAEWLAARVRLDRRVFRRIAHQTFDGAVLDDVLGQAPRAMPDRIRGALQLLRYQTYATGCAVLTTVGLLIQI